MSRLIPSPSRIEAAGNVPKIIDEFVGRVNSGTEAVSIARMTSPSGWIEPGQTPEFDEYTVVLRGMLRVTTRSGVQDVHAGAQRRLGVRCHGVVFLSNHWLCGAAHNACYGEWSVMWSWRAESLWNLRAQVGHST
jgi:hypothetical protein